LICFTEEPIISVLREHQAGLPIAELCRKHGISEVTFYAWRSRCGGMEVSDAKRLKAVRSPSAILHVLLSPTGADRGVATNLREDQIVEII
jgi:putative transposase